MRVLIVGCGYVGSSLGRELALRGDEGLGLSRSAARADELADAGIQLVTADITKPEDLRAVPGPFDWVVNTVSSTRGGVEEYERVFLRGMRHLTDWLTPSPPAKFVY